MNKNILIVVIAVTAMFAGYWFSTNLNSNDPALLAEKLNPEGFSGHVLDPARFIALPTLKKDDGSLFVIDDLKKHWSILFFGYTNCPDICPTTMGVLAQSLKQANDYSIKFPEVIFVSVDPKRDSIEMIGEYVRYFDPSFRGVTGEDKMVEALTLQTGVVYMQSPSATGNKENYIVDHSASLLVFNPEGKLKAYLKPPHTPESILKSLKILIL